MLLPAVAGAHTETGTTAGTMMGSGTMMMQQIEDEGLGNDALHQEMEDLMVKMMSGNLTDEEANRMTELMDQYPGPYATMMNRYSGMMGYGTGYGQTGWMMHDFGSGSAWGGMILFFCFLTWLVWFAVGVLALIWLWRHVRGNPSRVTKEN